MKTKVFLRMLFMVFLSVVGLTACSDDEPKDSVKEIRMQVSAVWEPLGFGKIEGFTYERGHEYYLSVRRTILANPPADASDRTYSLIRILEDRVVTEPEVPVDEEITSEEDIEYHDLCPFEKYAISKEFVVTAMAHRCRHTTTPVFGWKMSLTKKTRIGLNFRRCHIRRLIRMSFHRLPMTFV